jgi:hypothetical protein
MTASRAASDTGADAFGGSVTAETRLRDAAALLLRGFAMESLLGHCVDVDALRRPFLLEMMARSWSVDPSISHQREKSRGTPPLLRPVSLAVTSSDILLQM